MRVSVIAGLAGYLAIFTDVSAETSQRIPSVGILNYDAVQDIRVNQFHDALRELGYVEGRNLAVTYRWADGALDRLPDLAAELVASKVDVIIALGPAVWAAKRTTTTVPIVIAFSGDPVGDGVVSSLAQPGGNITGFSYMSTDLAAKRLELATKTFSKNNRIAVLYNPQEPATRLEMRETEAAARTLGVTLQPLAVRHAGELEQAFTAAVSERAEALLVFTHGFAVLNRARIIELAARHGLPTLYGWRDFVDEGGVMSYGPDIQVLVRQAASYVDRILKGAKPADLPVQRPTTFDLSINLKAAKALGLKIPESLMVRANRVIEE
jgi:putative tryptophan/tyrosine transport system substrate-binding protein